MEIIKKYLPYILAVVALVTLYFNWQQWEMMKTKKCNCAEEEQSAAPVMIP